MTIIYLVNEEYWNDDDYGHFALKAFKSRKKANEFVASLESTKEPDTKYFIEEIVLED